MVGNLTRRRFQTSYHRQAANIVQSDYDLRGQTEQHTNGCIVQMGWAMLVLHLSRLVIGNLKIVAVGIFVAVWSQLFDGMSSRSVDSSIMHVVIEKFFKN